MFFKNYILFGIIFCSKSSLVLSRNVYSPEFSCDNLDKDECISRLFCGWCDSSIVNLDNDNAIITEGYQISDYYQNNDYYQIGDYYQNLSNESKKCIKMNFCEVKKNSTLANQCIYRENSTNCFMFKLFEYTAVIALYIICIQIFCETLKECCIRRKIGDDYYDFYVTQYNTNLDPITQNNVFKKELKRVEKVTFVVYFFIISAVCAPALIMYFMNIFYFGCYTVGMLILLIFISCFKICLKKSNKKKMVETYEPLLN
jgi:hypothetical protein